MLVDLNYAQGGTVPGIITDGVGTLIPVLDYCFAQAGWDKPYSATNVAVYRNTEGTGGYLRIDDTNALEATFRVYESMTDANTGIDPTPLLTDLASGLYIRKAVSTGVYHGHWYFVGNEHWAYFQFSYGTSSNLYELYFFGDVYSVNAIDPYRFMVIGRHVTGSTLLSNGIRVGTTTLNGCYVMRGADLLTKAKKVARRPDSAFSGGVYFGTGTLPYPITANSARYKVAKCLVNDGTSTTLRGYMPNLYSPEHNKVFTLYSIVPGGDQLSGMTFRVFGDVNGQCLVRTDGVD